MIFVNYQMKIGGRCERKTDGQIDGRINRQTDGRIIFAFYFIYRFTYKNLGKVMIDSHIDR